MQKKAPLTEAPITLRLPTELLARIDALQAPVAADSSTATLLGGVSRSSVLRAVIVAGLDVLERRYRPGAKPNPAADSPRLSPTARARRNAREGRGVVRTL